LAIHEGLHKNFFLLIIKSFVSFLLLDADVRYCVLESLDDSFDSHLAQAENLSALFVAMNDEVFEIRELAICTIGRLSCMNPAYVMPSLRKTLIQVRFLFLHNSNINEDYYYCYCISVCVNLYWDMMAEKLE
jgi:phosphatidylinositol kinase/protein kinase (PI-3  family)